jgi:hypothetical protein
MGMSLQINKKTANTSKDIVSGEILNWATNQNKNKEELLIGDHQQHLKKAKLD